MSTSLIFAEQTLAELQRELKQLRAAKAADRERVCSVVRASVGLELHCVRQLRSEDDLSIDAIASRVADALAVPARMGLSEQERDALALLRADIAWQTSRRHAMTVLDRLLSARPIPPLVRELVQREFNRVPAGEQHEWERQRLQECLEALP